jgi:hypothetical protein
MDNKVVKFTKGIETCESKWLAPRRPCRDKQGAWQQNKAD